MGWLFFGATQVLLTSVTLGFLVEHDVISVDTRRITNPTVRSMFEGALDIGTGVANRAEQVAASVFGGK